MPGSPHSLPGTRPAARIVRVCGTVLAAGLLFVATGCSSAKKAPQADAPRQPATSERDRQAARPQKSPSTQTGLASWYGKPFHGRTTANGERYDMYRLTAAHRKLPFGTRVRVTSLSNGRSIDVRINDRGPFVHGRIIDLSYEAARKIGMISAGVDKVRVEVLSLPKS